MFDKNENDEVSFSDAYRSEILGIDTSDNEKSNSLLKILILLVIIVGGVIFAYFYLNNKQSSDDLPMPPKSSKMLDNIEELEKEISLPEESVEEEKSDLNSTEEPQKTSTQKGEDTYLEQLAELSKEIDGEK